MKRSILLIALLICNQLYAQSVKLISPDDTLGNIIGQEIITEFATKALNYYNTDRQYKARIYNYLRDNGFKDWDEVDQGMDELKYNRDIIKLVFKVSWRYCMGNNKDCILKDLRTIGVSNASSLKIAEYIISTNKEKAFFHTD